MAAPRASLNNASFRAPLEGVLRFLADIHGSRPLHRASSFLSSSPAAFLAARIEPIVCPAEWAAPLNNGHEPGIGRSGKAPAQDTRGTKPAHLRQKPGQHGSGLLLCSGIQPLRALLVTVARPQQSRQLGGRSGLMSRRRFLPPDTAHESTFNTRRASRLGRGGTFDLRVPPAPTQIEFQSDLGVKYR